MSVTESQPQSGVRWPADYYASETPRAILPSWAKYGCGGLSVFLLILIFAGGVFLANGGMVDLMDMVFSMTVAEMRPMFAKDVTEAQKQALDTEIGTLRKNLRDGKVGVPKLDPVLQAMRRATSDAKVTSGEVDEMISAARSLNAPAHALRPVQPSR
jgi:hypothetical protein